MKQILRVYERFKSKSSYLLTKIENFNKNEDGTILPMIAVVLILSTLLGATNFALVVMYRDRAVVRNALDAGATSSLAVATEKKKAIIYGEKLNTDKRVKITCTKRVRAGTSESGKPLYELVEYSFFAPRIQTWRNTENDIKNYIQLNSEQANLLAKKYFEENMRGNSLDFHIKHWSYDVTYDDKRIYTVKKNRTVVPIRPAFEPGEEPSGEGCNSGRLDIYNKVKNPEMWWAYDFASANTGSWTSPPG